MMRLDLNLNRSGKAGSSGGSSPTPWTPDYAITMEGFVTFVTVSQGLLVEPEEVMNYNYNESSMSQRPIFAVFYSPRTIQGHLVNCIDMVLYADSVQRTQIEGSAGVAVFGHTRSLLGTYAPMDPRSSIFAAKYEGIQAIMNRNKVFVPSYMIIAEGVPSNSMWTASVDMTQSSSWAVCQINFNDGGENNLDLHFSRAPIGTAGLPTMWQLFAATGMGASKYPIAIGRNGTSLYWTCWQPVNVGEGMIQVQLQMFSQDTAEPAGISSTEVAPLRFVEVTGE